MSSTRRTHEEARAFVQAHSELAPVNLVPELRLYLATESTPLWQATQAWLDDAAVPPPYWAFAWAGGQALARHILDRPEIVRARTVLDFGSGSGLVGLAAARAGAARVIAVDRDELAIAAAELNAEANELAIDLLQAEGLTDALARANITSGVVLAGDVFYDRADAESISQELRAAAARGFHVLAACPGRAYTPTDATTVASIEVDGTLELEGRGSRTVLVLSF